MNTSNWWGRVASHAVTGVLVVCTLIATGLLIRRELFGPDRVPVPNPFTPQPDWRDFTTGGHRVGPTAARTLLVAFADYQCPACRELDLQLRKTLAKFPQVAVVYRNYPLTSIHPFAMGAALASECAAKQGQFAAMHRVLYDSRDSVGKIPWRRVGEMSRVPNLNAFESCVSDSATMAVIQSDVAAGKALGVRGTPTVLVNGVRFIGTLRERTLDSLVKAAIKATPSR